MRKKDHSIHIENVSFHYPKRPILIFKNICLDIQPGHIYGLLGQNRVGKSTLLRLICGVSKPTEGSVKTFGYTPSDINPDMLSNLCLIPEEFVMPQLSIRAYADAYGIFYPKFCPEDLDNLCSRFSIPTGQKLSTMSLGQRKKAFIAFALACNTDLLLMDEPTNGLDIPSKRIFRDVMNERRSPDRTIIISTHQVRDLEQLISAIIIAHEEHIIVNTTVEALLKNYHVGEIDENADAIYEEKIMHRKYGVIKRPDGMPVDEQIDLELVFNAAICGTDFKAS